MEVWAGYREDSTLAGCDVIRGDVIPDGIFHIVSEVIVRHKDGDYLLMQRDYITYIFMRLSVIRTQSFFKEERLFHIYG